MNALVTISYEIKGESPLGQEVKAYKGAQASGKPRGGYL